MYEAKDYSALRNLHGLSNELIENHLKLYEGYVTNTNKTHEAMMAAEAGTAAHAELRRRFGWEFDGMRLHEYYFDGLASDQTELDADSALAKKITQDFGSVEAWRADFESVGAMRGIGWAILAYDEAGKKLINVWVNEHDMGHLAGTRPIIVMDVFEHAFMLDFGMKRADYIEAYFHAMSWKTAQDRFDAVK